MPVLLVYLLCPAATVLRKRPTPAPNVPENAVVRTLVADTVPGTTTLDWRAVGPLDGTAATRFVWTCGTFDPDVVDGRSIGP
jgi:hypothetical protein